VIGGGDWAEDRLIPDIVRSILQGTSIKIRSPYAIRPWQHVLEPLYGYLLLCRKLTEEGVKYAEAWNFGPGENDAINVETVVKYICNKWGKGISYEIDKDPSPHEANYLKLDCSKARSLLGWIPKWNIFYSLDNILSWTKSYADGENMREISFRQIDEYFS